MLRVYRFVIVVTVLLSVGCNKVRRTLSINSDPPGALVYMNDQEIGRTPVTRDFTWYGVYDVVIRKEGYQTLKTRANVYAPPWQWPPIDLVAEFSPVPLKDQQQLSFKLEPEPPLPSDDEMLGRAEQMRVELESSPFTRNPATQPVASPATVPTTQPAP